MKRLDSGLPGCGQPLILAVPPPVNSFALDGVRAVCRRPSEEAVILRVVLYVRIIGNKKRLLVNEPPIVPTSRHST